MIGRTIHNYVVKEQIGEGGMGAVYLAEHPKISRRVAIKVLLPGLSRDPQLVSRFFNEARAASEIRNEHIVDVLDFGELEDGSHYIMMEWLAGRSLGDTLSREGRLSLTRSIHIARGIGRALGAAHARGIVHRDLKPDNIYLVQHGEDADFVKVLDFGIAKLMLDPKSDFKTQAGAIMGTPYYMSPEQCSGTEIDQRTDVYALGVILFQMLCGRLPFAHTSLGALIAAHLTEQPPAPTRFEPSIPPPVEQALLQALEKDPAKRFSSIEALVRAFAHVQTGSQPIYPSSATHPVAAAPTPAPFPVPPTAPTPKPATTRIVPIARTVARTAAEIFVRIGIRGTRARLIASGAAVSLLLILFFALRRPTPATTVVASSPGRGSATAPADPQDPESDALIDKLHDGRSCKERRVAALALIATNDKRFLGALRAARERRGGGVNFGNGFAFGQGEVNGCMRKELDAAIRHLEQP